MKKIRLNRFFFNPPGISVVFMAGLLFAVAIVFIMLPSSGINEAIWCTPFDDIKPYGELLEDRLFGFWIYAAACLALAAACYRSFAGQSTSSYVMKRTKSGLEIHRMCLTVPLIGLLAGLLLTYLIALGGRTEYIRTFEPYHVPAEYFDFNFWRALI